MKHTLFLLRVPPNKYYTTFSRSKVQFFNELLASSNAVSYTHLTLPTIYSV